MMELLALVEHNEYLTVDEIAYALRTKRRTLVRSWSAAGVPYVQEGRDIRVHRDVVRARYLTHVPSAADLSASRLSSRSA